MSERRITYPESSDENVRTARAARNRDMLVAAIEEELALLRELRPRLSDRLDRAAHILVAHLSSSPRQRPLKCRVRHDGRRVLLVASLTANIAYEVSPADWSCSCPDHRRRGGQVCKHGISGWILYRAGLSREVVAHVDRVDEITARARAEADEEGPQGAADEQEGGDDGLTYEQVEGWLRGQRWIFARTRSGNPHFYCLKRNADDPRTFERVVDFINAKGMNYVWWGSTYRQLVANNSCYWTMSDSSQAQLINAKDLEQVRKDELRNRGGGGVQWRWLHGNVQEDRRELQREEAGQDELEGV